MKINKFHRVMKRDFNELDNYLYEKEDRLKTNAFWDQLYKKVSEIYPELKSLRKEREHRDFNHTYRRRILEHFKRHYDEYLFKLL